MSRSLGDELAPSGLALRTSGAERARLADELRKEAQQRGWTPRQRNRLLAAVSVLEEGPRMPKLRPRRASAAEPAEGHAPYGE